MRPMKTPWLVALVLLTLSSFAGHFLYRSLDPSLNVGPVDKKIVAQIKKRCAEGNACTLPLKEVVNDFEWDAMYVFEMGASRNDIESVIHAQLPSSPDLVMTLIFMDKGKLIHYEEEGEEIETGTDQALNFNIQQSGGHKEFSNNVVFSVSIQRFDHGVTYNLTQVH